MKHTGCSERSPRRTSEAETEARRGEMRPGMPRAPLSARALLPGSEGRVTVLKLKRGLDSSGHLPVVKTASERRRGPRLADARLHRLPAPQPRPRRSDELPRL